MLFKVLIVLLFIGNVVALSGAFITLMQDMGGSSKRTANLLFIRVSLAALLLLVVAYGVWSGDLNAQAPWDQYRS